jgi:hypothetical protein
MRPLLPASLSSPRYLLFVTDVPPFGDLVVRDSVFVVVGE